MPSQPINSIEYQGWDDLLLTHPKTTFFHTAAWARVLTESYNYKPLYFAILESKRLLGLIPVMEIRSFLTGKRGVSLPFTDECQPLGEDGVRFRHLPEHLTTFGKEAGWKHLEFRGGHASFAGAYDRDSV
jgi:hypothetical protein